MNTSSKLDQPRPFGRFLLTHKIAAGGMATVYKAETRAGDPLHGRQLAIKILHNHLSDSEDFVRMFRDEGHLAKQLEHANVVRVFEVSETEGDQYLVMEYVEGRNIAQLINAARLNSTTLPAGVIFEVLRQVLTALAYVHGVKGRNGRPLGIVHRDISPQNILISKDLIVKVTDFGIARGKHRSDQTRTGTVKGKLHYMAPEQAAGQRVDHRADLYALGAVAFEMLTGQPALGVDSTAVLQGRTIRGELDFSAKFRSQPEDVKAWLLKSLARLPDERFQSAEAMLGAMEGLGKASRRYYKPDAMLQWLELDEARGSQQRRRELFFDDEAVASGRVQAGAVRVQGEGRDEPRRLAAADVQRPISRVHLSPADREARLQRSVDWRVGDEPGLDVPAAARTGQRRAIVAPAATVPAATVPVATAPSAQRRAVVANEAVQASPPAIVPSSFSVPSPDVGELEVPRQTPRVASPAAKSPTRVTRVEAEFRSGLAMAQAVAGICAVFVLFAAALHVTGTHLDLPPLREDMVASLWDETPARTDAIERSPLGKGAATAQQVKATAAPRIVPVAPPAPSWTGVGADPVAAQLDEWAADDPGAVEELGSDRATAAGTDAKAAGPTASGSDEPAAEAATDAGAEDAAATPAVPTKSENGPVVPRTLSDEELLERGWEGREIQTVARPGELDPAERAARKKRQAEAAKPAVAAPAAPVAAKPEGGVARSVATAQAAVPPVKPVNKQAAPIAAKPVAGKPLPSKPAAAAASKPAVAKAAVSKAVGTKSVGGKPLAGNPAGGATAGKPTALKAAPAKPPAAKPGLAPAGKPSAKSPLSVRNVAAAKAPVATKTVAPTKKTVPAKQVGPSKGTQPAKGAAPAKAAVGGKQATPAKPTAKPAVGKPAPAVRPGAAKPLAGAAKGAQTAAKPKPAAPVRAPR